MTSKWIKEIEESPAVLDMSPASWYEYVEPVLLRIDKLLRLAMAGTDNSSLADRIWKEVQQEGETKPVRITAKRMTGVSAVIPISDEEAEKIFDAFDKEIKETNEDQH